MQKLKRFALGRMTARLRAAKALNSCGDPLGHFRVFNKMTISSLKIHISPAKNIKPQEFNVCVRQKIVQQLMTNSFLGELSRGLVNCEITAPVPWEWRRALEDDNIKINNWASSAAWALSAMRGFLVGVKVYFRLFFYSWKKLEIPKHNENDLVLPGLSSGNMPLSEYDFEGRKDFINWIVSREIQDPSKNIIAHLHGSSSAKIGPNVYRVPEIFRPIEGFADKMAYLVEGGLIACKALIRLLLFRWEYAFMYSDIVELIYLKRTKCMADKYVFCNSDFQFRPLWTYLAEKNGAQITYAFYSRNSQFIYPENQKIIPKTPGYMTMSWSNYMVWDMYQERFIRESSPWPTSIEVVGPVDFTDDGERIPECPDNRVTCAIFDVSAFQPLIAADKGILDTYYTIDIVNKFLKDIVDSLSEAGVLMYYKRKRPFIRIAATAYKNHVERIVKHRDVVMVGPEISARRLIENCDLVISIPYTSTANIGTANSKPSVYYDPTERLFGTDELAHGHRVLSGKRELNEWISKEMQKIVTGYKIKEN